MLTSTPFSGADRSSRFLRFVVECAVDGRREDIKESVVGVEVLGRSPTFDPKTDPIVRVEAGRLRTRLTSYYETEGKADPILITLPKGGYFPGFSEQRAQDRRTSPPRRQITNSVLLVTVGIVLGLTAAILMRSYFRTVPAAEQMKVSILPPGGMEILTSVISPDGRRIAFSGVSGDRQMLWVRELDSLEVKPLSGTEGAAYPFWSPDSRSLGFFSIDKMKRIEIARGTGQDVTGAGVPRGGAWSSGNTIVFAPRPRGGLLQVASSGGTPRPATELDPARGEVAHSFPNFLPDGRHFVFLAVSARPGESSIRVGSLDDTSSTFLTNADGSAQYVGAKGGSSGYLLFGDHGALAAQPFSAEGLKLAGVREVVSPEIPHLRGRVEFSVSETGILIYRGGSGKNRRLAWFDRQGKRLEDVSPANNYYSWSLSPDQKFVAYQEIAGAGGLESIWMLDLARGVLTRFTTGFEVFLPIWSSDSGEILFSDGGDSGMTLRRQLLNSGHSTMALDIPGYKFPSDWSSDGRFIAYSSPLPDARALTIWVGDLVGTAGQPAARPFLTGDGENGAQFSPAAPGRIPRWIAYTGLETGQREIYIRDFPAGRRKWRVSTAGGTQPRWRADGKELFYLGADGALMCVDIRDPGTLEAGSPRLLFHTGLRNRRGIPDIVGQDYAPSKDGQRFLVNRLIDGGEAADITLIRPWPRITR